MYIFEHTLLCYLAITKENCAMTYQISTQSAREAVLESYTDQGWDIEPGQTIGECLSELASDPAAIIMWGMYSDETLAAAV